MGQYKFWMTPIWQLGFLFRYSKDVIEIHFPFLEIIIGLQKEASGVYLFGKEF